MTHKTNWIERIRNAVATAAEIDHMVNISGVADEVFAAHPEVSFLETEQTVLAFAELSGAPMVFDRGRTSHVIRGLVMDFVDEDGDDIIDVQPLTATRNGNDPSTGNVE